MVLLFLDDYYGDYLKKLYVHWDNILITKEWIIQCQTSEEKINNIVTKMEKQQFTFQCFLILKQYIIWLNR